MNVRNHFILLYFILFHFFYDLYFLIKKFKEIWNQKSQSLYCTMKATMAMTHEHAQPDSAAADDGECGGPSAQI